MTQRISVEDLYEAQELLRNYPDEVRLTGIHSQWIGPGEIYGFRIHLQQTCWLTERRVCTICSGYFTAAELSAALSGAHNSLAADIQQQVKMLEANYSRYQTEAAKTAEKIAAFERRLKEAGL